jgi:hypothetical protein
LGWRFGFAATSERSSASLGAERIELRFPVDRAPRRCQRRGMAGKSLGLTSHNSSCNRMSREPMMTLPQIARLGAVADRPSKLN